MSCQLAAALRWPICATKPSAGAKLEPEGLPFPVFCWPLTALYEGLQHSLYDQPVPISVKPNL